MSLDEEEDCKRRDGKGLRPGVDTRVASESRERIHYFTLYGLILAAAPFIAFVVYCCIPIWSPRLSRMVEDRLQFIANNDLHWVYFSWYAVFVTRCYMSINANGARLPARVDRPDQHVYRVMSSAKPFADMPYVLMVNTGVIGRFNRAQRAAAHMDEFMGLFLTALLLGAAVFGPLSFFMAATYAVARISYANAYTKHAQERLRVIVMIIASEHIVAGFVLFIALKSVAVARSGYDDLVI